MVWIVAAFIMFVWLLVLGVLHLQGRYRYTRRSRLILAAEAPAAGLVALAATLLLWPALGGWARPAVIVALAVPLYVAVAVVTVELWRKVRQRTFDDRIAALEAEEEGLLARCRRLEAELEAVERRQRRRDEEKRRRAQEAAWLRRRLDAWQQGEGLTRVRSMRVAEWEEELSSLDAAGLRALQRRLDRELAARRGSDGRAYDAVDGTDAAGAGDGVDAWRADGAGDVVAPEDADTEAARRRRSGDDGPDASGKRRSGDARDVAALEAQLCLVQLTLLARPEVIGQEELAFARAARDAGQQLERSRARLRRVRQELTLWRRKRDGFLSQRITLG